MKTLAKYFV